ncbi:bacterial transferase hexapeptide family protein [Acinetobacter sp. 1294596]|uniref:acetyltransferase n=1 Tax=Acinetobacter TaxID=469 RepID=UPI0004466F03|nr:MULTISPECIES: acetyltransferase [Acinetobacter]EXF57471.1 bacterial transferase hexapeptide family protein [Acinetobacter sp. 1294596]MCK4096237.1 acetyltransferase [Acinetobacter radioresistens]
MPKKKLIILGAGGFGQSLAELAALLEKWEGIYFADDRWPEHQCIDQYNIISDISSLKNQNLEGFEAIVAVGNNQIRQKWLQLLLDLSVPLTTIIHPQAVIAPSVNIEQGVIIMAGCVIGSNSLIQEGVILNIGTLLDHDVIVEEYAHLSIGARVASGQYISRLSFLEVGTTIGH